MWLTSFLFAVMAPHPALSVTYPLNQTSPIGATVNDSVPGGVSRGYRFRANSAVSVTQLGMVVPSGSLGRQINLKLWNVSTQALVASASLQASGAETWQWANLPTPVSLTAATDYVVTLSSALGPWAYFYSTNLPFLPTGVISFVEMRYSNSGDIFPAEVLEGVNYGFVDIGYEAASQPPPTPPIPPTPPTPPTPPSPPSDAVATPISGTAQLLLLSLMAGGGTWTLRRRRGY